MLSTSEYTRLQNNEARRLWYTFEVRGSNSSLLSQFLFEQRDHSKLVPNASEPETPHIRNILGIAQFTSCWVQDSSTQEGTVDKGNHWQVRKKLKEQVLKEMYVNLFFLKILTIVIIIIEKAKWLEAFYYIYMSTVEVRNDK